MAKKQNRQASAGHDLQSRLTALGGLVIIVGVAAAVLFFAGILGGQGGFISQIAPGIRGPMRMCSHSVKQSVMMAIRGSCSAGKGKSS